MYEDLCRQLRTMASAWGILLPRDAADSIEKLEEEKQRLRGKMRLFAFIWNHLPKSELNMLLQMYREQDGDGE